MTRTALSSARTIPSSCRRSITTLVRASLLKVLVLVAFLPSSAFASFIPEIDLYWYAFGQAGDTISVTGSNFTSDPTNYVGVIRDVDDGNCALALATQASGTHINLQLEDVVHGFHGELEVQVGEMYSHPTSHVNSGPRHYIVLDTQIFEATCRIDAGPFQVLSPPAPPSYQSIPMAQELWVNDTLPNAAGIVRCAILASTPPPCGHVTLDAYGEPMPLGPPSFVARTKIVQISGGAPEDEAARASDMAMALNQAFGAMGLQVSAQGEWLVLSSPYGLAGTTFSFGKCDEP